jgi:restriction endonuclease S subunit
MKRKLKYISTIRYGFHHSPVDLGSIIYLQTNNFDSLGRLGNVDTYLPLEKPLEKCLLEDGDILLPAKGNRHFAWVYREKYGLAIASSIFFIIKPQEDVLPDYLAAILNLPQNLAHFQKLSGGNKIPSFSKKELEELDIPIVPKDVQIKIVDISNLYTHELHLLENLKDNFTIRFKTLVSHLTQ